MGTVTKDLSSGAGRTVEVLQKREAKARAGGLHGRGACTGGGVGQPGQALLQPMVIWGLASVKLWTARSGLRGDLVFILRSWLLFGVQQLLTPA